MGVIDMVTMTPMSNMVKTQVYIPSDELKALHRIAKGRKMKVAEVREAIRATHLRPKLTGPVGLFDGEIHRSSADHDSAFDEL
jgi:hypothetical protein